MAGPDIELGTSRVRRSNHRATRHGPKTLNKIGTCSYLYVFRNYLMRENDVTPSNVMEMKLKVTKQIKMTSC